VFSSKVKRTSKLLLFTFVLCSCTQLKKTSQNEPRLKNAYTDHYSKKNSKSLKSSFEFFISHPKAFLSSIKIELHNSSLLNHFQKTFSLKNFHPLNVDFQSNSQQAQIKKNIEASEQQWWVNIVKMEIANSLLAQSRTLGQYRIGTCIDAYKRGLKDSFGLQPSLEALRPIGASKLNASTYRELKITDFKNLSDLGPHTAWMCHELGKAHKENFSQADADKLYFNLDQNKQFRNKLLRLSAQEILTVLDSYRYLLRQSLKTNKR